MKHLFKICMVIVATVLFFTIGYLLGAFMEYSLYPNEWEDLTRDTLAVVSGCVALVAILIAAITDIDD